ncbi:MAG TPA: hypothetical protein ENJ26_04555 [Rhodobacteraceae bacterium]|nr:hypothetical protein [Paracoccaceae bacterium]
MFRRLAFASLMAGAMVVVFGSSSAEVSAQQGYGQPTDWNRFYYYPYIYYPQNFQRYQSHNHMYYRYDPQMQIPVYNKDWYNFYPTDRPWHKGKHFIMDTF